MPNDPLDPLKRIQAHLEALRRARGLPPGGPVSGAGVDPSQVRFQWKGPFAPAPAAVSAPDPLVEWLLEDLPPRAFHDLVSETASRLKLKGYRAGHLPRPEGLRLLKKRYDKEPAFRPRCHALWLQGRKKEADAFKLLPAAEVRKDPWPVVERFGFPLALWMFLLSAGGLFRSLALQVLKEVTAKAGRLEELLAQAAQKKDLAADKLWSLPPVSHDEDLSRLQAEVEQILAERDRWQAEARTEKERGDRAQAGVQRLEEEVQKLSRAKSAAEQGRQEWEARARALESHLEKLKDAESALKRLEKQVKEMEHEKSQWPAEKDRLAGAAAEAARERDGLKRRLAERERTLAFLRVLAAPGDPPPSGPVYQGEVLLLITAAAPAPFFEAAKRTGLTLLVHDGRSHNAQLDKFLEQAWRVLALGEADTFHEGVWGALRASGKPLVALPPLDAAAFERLIRTAAPLFQKL